MDYIFPSDLFSFILLCMAVVSSFFFLSWLGRQVCRLIPRDSWEFKLSRYKKYDRIFK